MHLGPPQRGRSRAPLHEKVMLLVAPRYGRPGRLHLCTMLAADHGRSLRCPWGNLSWLFRNVPALRGQTQLRVLTGQAWEIRNELGHYRPVQFAKFVGCGGSLMG